VDGSYFGTSFPHVFIKHYPEAIILPPKIYFYEPKIFGFNINGKRGSKEFQPEKGTIKYVEDSLTGIDKERIYNEFKDLNKANGKQS
jgi:Casein kinase II regulatory subunit